MRNVDPYMCHKRSNWNKLWPGALYTHKKTGLWEHGYESWKNICSKHEIQMHFKGGSPRTEIPSGREVRWYIDTSVAEWTVKKNILGSQAEHLQKDTKNTWKAHHPSMTTITPLVMIYLLTASALLTEKIKIWQDPSKKPFSSELMTNPLIEIQANTNCYTYVLKYWWIYLSLGSSNKPNNIKASRWIASVTYRMVLYNMNHNISLITSWLQWHNNCCTHIGSITPWTSKWNSHITSWLHVTQHQSQTMEVPNIMTAICLTNRQTNIGNNICQYITGFYHILELTMSHLIPSWGKYCEGQYSWQQYCWEHFPQTWGNYLEDLAKACL